MLAADLIGFETGIDLVGVSRLDDGTSVLVGNRFSWEHKLSEGVVLTVDPAHRLFTEAVVRNSAHDTFLMGASPNGQFLAGYSRASLDAPFRGFRSEAVNSNVQIGTGSLGEFAASFAVDVSDSGIVVGTTEGMDAPFRWEPNSGTNALAESPGANVQAISSSGSVVGYVATETASRRAALWEDSRLILLETPDRFGSMAADISPNGEYIGGELSVVDHALSNAVTQAVVWRSDALYRLEGADGDFFEGSVLAVSDNGYAVGEGQNGGFIWHESFHGVRMFDEWLSTEFDLTLPTHVAAVKDVHFDGENLRFATNDSPYLVAVKLFDRRPFPFQNEINPSDVNGDYSASPIDALLVINELNRSGSRELPNVRRFDEAFLDVDGDGYVAPVDALISLAFLNSASQVGHGSLFVDVTPSGGILAENHATVSTLEDTSYVFSLSDFLLEDVDAVQGIDIDEQGLRGTLTLYDQVLSTGAFVSRSAIGSGEFAFVPAANENGNGYSWFSYKLGDGKATELTTYRMNLDVIPINDAPIAEDQVYSTNEDTILHVIGNGVLHNDHDIESDPFTAVRIRHPQHGKVTLNSDGSFIYKPDPDFFGTDSFTYVAEQDGLYSNPATVTINVSPVNDAPVADDMVFNVAFGSIFHGIPQYRDIDARASGDQLFATLLDSPNHGFLLWRDNGTFIYAPDAGFVGVDSLSYQLSDGSLSDSATITFNVQQPTVEFTLMVVDSERQSVESARVGDQLTLVAYVKDSREAPEGVFGAYLDVTYDPNSLLLMGVPQFGEQSGGEFTYSQSGDTSLPGLIDNVGGVRLSGVRTWGASQFLFSIPFSVTDSGPLTFRGRPDRTHDILVLGQNNAIEPSLLVFNGVTIQVEPASP